MTTLIFFFFFKNNNVTQYLVPLSAFLMQSFLFDGSSQEAFTNFFFEGALKKIVLFIGNQEK